MTLSVILGALIYVAVQFAWYSPWGVGRTWLALKKASPAEAIAGLRTPTLVPEGILHLLAPALLTSAAIHVLDLVLASFPQTVFLGAVAGLFLLTAGPKYWRLARAEREARELALISDGAPALSLFALAFFVTVVGYKLY